MRVQNGVSGQKFTFNFLKYKPLNHTCGLTWKNNLANIYGASALNKVLS